MIELVIRADDLGYSEAVNYGIEKTVKEGLVGSVGVMPNMPSVEHGLKLLEGTGVCLGQHTNICLGKPCANPVDIPSLLGENGELRSSREYREAYKRGEEFTVLEEMVIEIEAQYHRFVELTGQQPKYFEAHAVISKHLMQALEIVAEKYNLPFASMNPGEQEMTFKGRTIAGCPMNSMLLPEQYDACQSLKDAVLSARKDVPNIYICHPGYLDDYILKTSSLTINRTKEVAMLCEPEMRAWLNENEVRLITYEDIR